MAEEWFTYTSAKSLQDVNLGLISNLREMPTFINRSVLQIIKDFGRIEYTDKSYDWESNSCTNDEMQKLFKEVLLLAAKRNCSFRYYQAEGN
jgi:hypothetical protein